MAKYYGEGKKAGHKPKKGYNRKASPSAPGGEYPGGFSNMPSELVMKEYPRADYGGPMGYRDDREGLDMLSKDANKKILKGPGGRFAPSGRAH